MSEAQAPGLQEGGGGGPDGAHAPNLGLKKKKTRRGKSKRKTMKPFSKRAWQRRRYRLGGSSTDRTSAASKSRAPYNTTQFLMEVHMPEAELFQPPRPPSVRTRDSSFSVDSEENYFYSLPEDEVDFLTKEFSSVYEDAQSERLASMTKEQLLQEYLVLETKVNQMTERLVARTAEPDAPPNVFYSSRSVEEMLVKLKEQEDKIRELQTANETLRIQNEILQRQTSRSTEDDDSSSSTSGSSSSSCSSPETQPDILMVNGHAETMSSVSTLTNGPTLVNGRSPETNGHSRSPTI